MLTFTGGGGGGVTVQYYFDMLGFIYNISLQHRAFWRELYTVEEAEHLQVLNNMNYLPDFSH